MFSNVKGIFKNFDANIETSGDDFATAKIAFWINLSSIETGDKARDEHLKSPEFFDIKKYKKITFVSDSFKKSDKKDNYILWGYLTMKGVTHRIKLEVYSAGIEIDVYGHEKADFYISGKLSRKDWGLNWNVAGFPGSVMGSDEAYICCNLKLLKSEEEEFALETVQSMEDKN